MSWKCLVEGAVDWGRTPELSSAQQLPGSITRPKLQCSSEHCYHVPSGDVGTMRRCVFRARELQGTQWCLLKPIMALTANQSQLGQPTGGTANPTALEGNGIRGKRLHRTHLMRTHLPSRCQAQSQSGSNRNSTQKLLEMSILSAEAGYKTKLNHRLSICQ